jgi:hypothetical protein
VLPQITAQATALDGPCGDHVCVQGPPCAVTHARGAHAKQAEYLVHDFLQRQAANALPQAQVRGDRVCVCVCACVCVCVCVRGDATTMLLRSSTLSARLTMHDHVSKTKPYAVTTTLPRVAYHMGT